MVKKLTALMFFISFYSWAQIAPARPAAMTSPTSIPIPGSPMSSNYSQQSQTVKLTFEMPLN